MGNTRVISIQLHVTIFDMANTENLYNTKMVYGEFVDKNSSDSWSVNSAIQKL